jgi:hypothetical protein
MQQDGLEALSYQGQFASSQPRPSNANCMVPLSNAGFDISRWSIFSLSALAALREALQKPGLLPLFLPHGPTFLDEQHGTHTEESSMLL